MPQRLRRRSTRSRRRAVRRRFVATVALLCVAIAAIVWVGEYVRSIRATAFVPPEIAAVVPESVTPELAIAEAAGAGRPVFPYSIIEGGARTSGELSRAIESDSLVAEHFAGFDLAHTRVERLKTSRAAYVSYRLDNQVFWTKNPVVIPAGERVLTDGQHVARTRCGNRLATDPGAVSPKEPAAAVLDTPILPARGLALVSILAPPGLPSALPGVSVPPVSPGGLASGVASVVGPGALNDPGTPSTGDGGVAATPPEAPPTFDPPGPPPSDPPPGPVPPESDPPRNTPTPPDDEPPVEEEPPQDGTVPEPGVSLLVVCATFAFGVKRMRRQADRPR